MNSPTRLQQSSLQKVSLAFWMKWFIKEETTFISGKSQFLSETYSVHSIPTTPLPREWQKLTTLIFKTLKNWLCNQTQLKLMNGGQFKDQFITRIHQFLGCFNLADTALLSLSWDFWEWLFTMSIITKLSVNGDLFLQVIKSILFVVEKMQLFDRQHDQRETSPWWLSKSGFACFHSQPKKSPTLGRQPWDTLLGLWPNWRLIRCWRVVHSFCLCQTKWNIDDGKVEAPLLRPCETIVSQILNRDELKNVLVWMSFPFQLC